MGDDEQQQWHRQYTNNGMPLISQQWIDGLEAQRNSMQQLDLGMLQQPVNGFIGSYPGTQAPILSPNLSYQSDFLSDIDMRTLENGAFPAAVNDPLRDRQPPQPSHLHLPQRAHIGSNPLQSPHTSHSGLSPSPQPQHPQSPDNMRIDGRPATKHRRATEPASATAAVVIKRTDPEDEEEEDFVPNEDAKGRGRKRQRIPHTAVERRYRENLNAHLDRLRQAVPSLASRSGPDGAKALNPNEGVKPSKCEILNGAIEHIGAQDREIAALKKQVEELRATVGKMQGWYRVNQR